MKLAPGHRIDIYTLVAYLGNNSFGPVWSARESILNRLVRINFLDKDDDLEIYRFTRVTSILSRLNHPAIVKLTGSGYVEYNPYSVTEHVPGPTLASLISNGGRMDELRVLQIASQVADGLHHGWMTAKIIHRHLSPDTILVDLESLSNEDLGVHVKITDFGHALGERLVDHDDDEAIAGEAEFLRLTKSEIVGNLLTMAPEQIRGCKLTPTADMYALGVIIYLLLTGKPPFSGSDEEIRNAHLRATPLDLASLVPGLQSGTAGLVRRLLAKSPEARFPDWASCFEKVTALRQQLEAKRKPPVVYVTPNDNRQSPTDPEIPPPGSFERHGGGETSRILRRRTDRFIQTPRGQALPGGVQGGGGLQLNIASPELRTDSVPDFIPSVSAPQTAPSEHQLLFALLAERVRQNSSTQPKPTPTPTLAKTATPTLDDGLTAEQRAAIWSYLFRASTIPEASLPGKQAILDLPDNRPPLPEINVQGKTIESPHRSSSSDQHPLPSPLAKEEPIAPEFMPEEQPLPSSTSFNIKDNRGPSTNEATHSDDVPTSPTEEFSRKLTQSPWWKSTLEILRVAVIGRVRYQHHPPATLTQRFTSRLRRLAANREATMAEAAQLVEVGKFDDAEKLIDQVASSRGAAGNDHGMCLLRSRICALRGDGANAMCWAQLAVGQQNESPVALAIVGYYHLHGRRLHAATTVFEEIHSRYPHSPLGPLGQASIHLLAGFHAKAEEALSEASHQGNLPAIRRLSALLCRAKGDIDGEIGILRKMLTGTDADWEINERLGELVQRKL